MVGNGGETNLGRKSISLRDRSGAWVMLFRGPNIGGGVCMVAKVGGDTNLGQNLGQRVSYVGRATNISGTHILIKYYFNFSNSAPKSSHFFISASSCFLVAS